MSSLVSRLNLRRASSGGFTLRKREALACALFIAPAVFGFLAFAVTPLIISAYISLTNYNFVGWPKLVGFQNYAELFDDKFFLQSVRVTVTYALVVVPGWIVSSLALALVMNQRLPGMSIFRTIFYLPAVLSGVAIAILWKWIFNARSGLLNIGLGFLGIEGPAWVTDENWALPSIILMSLWTAGWYLPVWLGGLQRIPTELYEAADIDGAGWWARLLNVTLPMLSPVILYNLIMNIIYATQLFTEPMVMMGNAPAQAKFATLSYVLHLYNNAFSDVGQATAMAWLMFLVVLALSALVFRFSPFWVHTESEGSA